MWHVSSLTFFFHFVALLLRFQLYSEYYFFFIDIVFGIVFIVVCERWARFKTISLLTKRAKKKSTNDIFGRAVETKKKWQNLWQNMRQRNHAGITLYLSKQNHNLCRPKSIIICLNLLSVHCFCWWQNDLMRNIVLCGIVQGKKKCHPIYRNECLA